MFGSTVIDVIIGLAFVFWLLSVIASSLNEWISQLFAMRSTMLEAALRNLLRDSAGNGVAGDLMKHPLVLALYRKGWVDRLLKRDGKPSYMAPRTFALALMDVVAPSETATPRAITEISAFVTKNLKDKNPQLEDTLLALLRDADSDMQKFRKGIERWFDDGMERASGWYKRQIQFFIIIIALVLTFSANVDTIAVTSSLWHDGTLRELLVVEASRAVSAQPQPTGAVSPQPQPTGTPATDDPQARLLALDLPVGWFDGTGQLRPLPNDLTSWLGKILGLLITTVAISLGAPFWFDLLSKLVNLRLTGEPPKKEDVK